MIHMKSESHESLYIQSPKLNQLNILREVSTDTHITQAELARRCSLSVAMVNNYMKDLCSLGLLEYHRRNSKTVTYHLTALGVERLESLQIDLIESFSRLFAEAQEVVRSRILKQAKEPVKRVVLIGNGPLTRLVLHSLESSGISILGVCDEDPDAIGSDVCGRQVLDLTQVGFMTPGAVVVTVSSGSPEMAGVLSDLDRRGFRVIHLCNQSEEESHRGNGSKSILRPKDIAPAPVDSSAGGESADPDSLQVPLKVRG